MAWGGDGYTGATVKFAVAVLVPEKAPAPYPLLAQNHHRTRAVCVDKGIMVDVSRQIQGDS